MTPDQLQHFKIALQEELARLDQELNDIGSKDPNNPNHFEPKYPESGGNSLDDNAGEVSEYADDLSIEARLETERRDTMRALELIEQGKYGVCKYCAKEIDLKRLEARPASSSCIDCKKLLTQEM